LLACADIEEGSVLRAAGVRADILVFGALSVSDLDGLFDCRLTPTISTPGAAKAVQAAAARYKQRLRYHLKIDTGMNRLGFRFDNLGRSLPGLIASENLELAAIYTHFATADDPVSELFEQQRLRFDRALDEVARLRGERSGRDARPFYRHASNSAAPASRLARLARSGPSRPAALRHRAAAVGVDHSAGTGHEARQPRRRGERDAPGRGHRLRRPLHGRAADERRDRASRLRGRSGPPAGRPRLGADSRTPRADRRLGVHGHADGRCHRPRRVARGRSRHHRIAGPTDRIDVREMAATIGTIPWEIVCRVGSRIERVYK
jgi:alanine racemase